MNPALRLAHMVVTSRKELWNAEEVRRLAREASKERDELVMRVAELERKTRAIPRFQGMTELA